MPLPLLIAVQFLTRLPVRLPGMPPAAAGSAKLPSSSLSSMS